MNNDPGLAEIGYHAYGSTTDHKNYQGLPMPTWPELPEKQKTAWHTAADAIAQALLSDDQKENLTFGQALEALQQGKKVARAIWGGYWQMEHATFHHTNSRNMMLPIAHLKDGGEEPAQPYWSDMLANDWKIIE